MHAMTDIPCGKQNDNSYSKNENINKRMTPDYCFLPPHVNGLPKYFIKSDKYLQLKRSSIPKDMAVG